MAVTTLYPSSGNGWLGHSSASTWSGDRDATNADSGQVQWGGTASDGLNVHGWNDHIRRPYFPFDLSSIPSGDIITGAVLKVYVYSDLRGGNYDNGVNVFQTPQSSLTELVMSEYNIANWDLNPGATEIPTVSAGNFLEFTLNSTGLAWLPPGGNAFLGLLLKNDYDNNEITGGANNLVYQYLRWVGHPDVGTRPTLVITHEAGGGGGGAAQAARRGAVMMM